ncbi:hypothetical protein LPJ66_009143 [Kickxella alabastrina]|uniref:Uncharacterized protein n=1 Tax=Kickxella alabastrina TaxID=61397 RepID=A0ACC1I8D4_9FUNG|nr:hypothetical protein LPJ66_009143 [Kickxella alabastrina]
MLPARQQKVDLSKLTPEEQTQFKKYGKLPVNKNVLTQKIKERKYFDSGDYAMSKAGKTDEQVGDEHPSVDTIPHSQTPINPGTLASSPTTETGGAIPVSGGASGVIPSCSMVHPTAFSPPKEYSMGAPALSPVVEDSVAGDCKAQPLSAQNPLLRDPIGAAAAGPEAGGPPMPRFVRRASNLTSGAQIRIKDQGNGL